MLVAFYKSNLKNTLTLVAKLVTIVGYIDFTRVFNVL